MSILLGTIYPFIIDALGLGKLSVGAPYFNTIFIPLMLPVLFVMGLGIHINWHRDAFIKVFKELNTILIFSIMLPTLIFVYDTNKSTIWMYLGLSLATWILLSNIRALWQRCRLGINNINSGFLGMIIAHTGIAITVIGITISSGFGQQDDVKMHPGSTLNFNGYNIQFISEKPIVGPNYHSTQAHFIIYKFIKHLYSLFGSSCLKRAG